MGYKQNKSFYRESKIIFTFKIIGDLVYRISTEPLAIGSFLLCQTPGLVLCLGFDFVLPLSQQQQEPN